MIIKKILIVLAGSVDINLKLLIQEEKINFIVAIDGGYDHLAKLKIKPNILIGDFDSYTGSIEEVDNIICLPTEKDLTDFEYTLNYLNDNFLNTKKYVVGYMDKYRIEHYYANLNLINFDLIYLTKYTAIYCLEPGFYSIRYPSYISFFAKENISNFQIKGFKYELDNHELTIHNNLCISNELNKNYGTIKFTKGKLLVFLSEGEIW